MTAPAEATTGTELAQVAPGALALAIGKAPWTIGDLLDRLVPQIEELPTEGEFPELPKPASVTPALKKALRELPAVFGEVKPTARRTLEKDELKKITDEALAISKVTKPLGTRLKAISEIVRTHMDVQAEKDALAIPEPVIRGGRTLEPTPRVAAGVAKDHYLLAQPEKPYEISVEGYDDTWQARHTKGDASQSHDELLRLYDEEKITREEYLGFTETRRTLSGDKIAAAIKKNPERSLQILAAITTREAPSYSLYAPKK